MSNPNTLSSTVNWFKTVFSKKPVMQQNINAQLGCHFEEVAEMIEAMQGESAHVEHLLTNTHACLTELANYLKTYEHNDLIMVTFNKMKLADSLGDQIVTAAGVAEMNKIDIIGALDEINRSNFSKFSENGEPVFKEGGKIAKSALYTPPDLTPFI